MPRQMTVGISARDGKASIISQRAVVDCCTMMWPVINTVRSFVTLRKATSNMFMTNATSRATITREVVRPTFSIAANAAD